MIGNLLRLGLVALSTVTLLACGGGSSASTICTLMRPNPWVTQPQSITVAAGQTATFSVTIANGAQVSYQWARNGVSIAGATASSYTTPATTAADNGASFTVFVTVTYTDPPPCNTSQTYQSAAAILTVQ